MKVDSINIGLPASLKNLQNLRPKGEKKRVGPSVSGQETSPIKPELEKKNKDIVPSVETLGSKESNRAFFALDDDKNVVIRIVDSEGNLVKQVPPEEYQKTADLLKDSMRDLFHVEV